MSPRTNPAVAAAARLLLNRVAPRLDSRVPASTRPFDKPFDLLPHTRSRTWAWTHYGVFVPQLPAPYRYLNTMTFIGATGTQCFDNDHLAAPDARDTATVLSATAHGPGHHYRAYDTSTDCGLADDGSRLAWGDDLVITADHPRYTVTGRYAHLSVDLDITATDQVSWFVRTPVYGHFSLLATFTGAITDDRGRTEVGGLCTVEYARCASPQALTSKPLPERYKLPADFFTYQIVNLDERTQLLLTDVRAAGATAARLAHLRTLDGAAEVFEDVAFEVLAYQDEPAVDPWGRRMRVPTRMRWTVRDGGAEVVALDAEVDSPLRHGHGRGYVAAYTYTGRWRGEPVAGTGYLEWVDCLPGSTA